MAGTALNPRHSSQACVRLLPEEEIKGSFVDKEKRSAFKTRKQRVLEDMETRSSRQGNKECFKTMKQGVL